MDSIQRLIIKNWIVKKWRQLKMYLSGHNHLWKKIYRLDSDVLEIRAKDIVVLETLNKIKEVEIKIINENRLRIRSHRELRKEYEQTHENFSVHFDARFLILKDKLEQKIDNIFKNRYAKFDYLLLDLHNLANSMDEIKEISEDAKTDYQNYLDNILKFKVSDHSIMRLASLEERLTLIENKKG